ncbi:hypothetical protein IGK74_000006 [Enterococcus sp. AZ150]|uniref:YolD-like protein n=1 Tax=Enterococcus sulfureus ATCC 49903 TaxID=1140003 RepID=S0KYA1_9ENTE|nr:hypothetical protein [Enterococcus sulfureus]EOT46020.1 hypothetical protein OMY_01840 [Enterococcus sulfureus ATCC 49903]EOT83129.1 hypothetical protein I573_02242 [Enterococcus sulfureus ATCC 49903]
MKKEHRLPTKMGQLLSFSSKILVNRFLTDEEDEVLARIQQEELKQRLQLAATQSVLVVLHIETKKATQFETISGFIANKTVDGSHIIVKSATAKKQLRMIEVASIVKMSQLPLTPPNKPAHEA